MPFAAPGCLLVDAEQVHQLLDIDRARDAVEAAFLAQSDADAIPPVTAGLHAPDGVFHVKSAVASPPTRGARRYVVAKINANFPSNPSRFGLPTIQGLLVLFDGDRGTPLAVMDSGSVTVIRTAAATAVAVKHLARTDASTLGVVGCGAQAMAQVAAIRAVRPITDVHVFDTNPRAASGVV